MNSPVVVEHSEETSEPGVEGTDYEVVVIGAGVGGIYQIKRLIDLGVNATVLEGEDDLGGTWYRNRYPGARFDSESFTYGYSWDQEILDEWHWTEMFSPQPETLKYLNFVAEKFGLREHMQFNCYVEKMVFDEDLVPQRRSRTNDTLCAHRNRTFIGTHSSAHRWCR